MMPLFFVVPGRYPGEGSGKMEIIAAKVTNSGIMYSVLFSGKNYRVIIKDLDVMENVPTIPFFKTLIEALIFFNAGT